jgi:arabinogalactan endo-1,4-beta-galactosidase
MANKDTHRKHQELISSSIRNTMFYRKHFLHHLWLAWVLIFSLTASSVEASYGEAEMSPIESNIALKFWVSTSASSANQTTALAHDDDLDTVWLPQPSTAGTRLILDLGGTYGNLRKSEVIFADPRSAYQYTIESSPDGKNWELLADRSENSTAAEGYVDLFTRPGIRSLRLKVLGTSPAVAVGIREWRVYNYLREDIVNGADMSYMDQYRLRKYYLNPNPQLKDMGPGPHVLDVVKDRGMKLIRLRIWNEPRSEENGFLSNPGYISPARQAEVARWIKERGLQLAIDFHYADSWADPGKQPKPQAWASLAFDDLTVAVHDFTYNYIKLLVEQGTAPEQVAVGNEIINGFLWGSESEEMEVSKPPYVVNNKALYWSQPGGGLLWKYWGSSEPAEQEKYQAAWERFAALVAAGISAVREASPETAVEIHVVSDQGKLEKTMEFWQQLLSKLEAKGAEPDLLALSYYPEWHGTYQNLEAALYAMASTYPQYKIQIAETAYPASGSSHPMPNADQPQTVQGQANMLMRTIQAANDIINNQGTGVLVWEPQSYQPMFRAVPGMVNTFEPYASLDVYQTAFAAQIIAQPIYMTVFEREAPALPHTVQVMQSNSGEIANVELSWQAVDPALHRYPGRFTVSAESEYGTVTAMVRVTAKPSRVFRRSLIEPR